jgi:hypothetical protein
MTKSTDDPKGSLMLANRSVVRKTRSPVHTRSVQYPKAKPKPNKSKDKSKVSC